MLCDALTHPDCAIEVLHLSGCGIKADREDAQPSSLPPSVYGIKKTDTHALSALYPQVRTDMLRHFEYPTAFRASAQRKGLSLPSLEVLCRMEPPEMAAVWEQVSSRTQS